MKDLGEDSAFEEKQRRMPPPVYTDDEDVTTTANSIKKAEGITGGSMEEPFDPLVVAKIAPTVAYTLADSDDEEEDTVETRRSVKYAEKYYKKRFFINKREKEDFEQGVASGTIDPKVVTFEEGADTSITANANAEIAKEGEKKVAAGAASAAAAVVAKDPAAAKEATATAAAASDKAKAMDLPPELDPAAAKPAKMLMQKQAYANHEFADLD
jgi:hypothetical protein